MRRVRKGSGRRRITLGTVYPFYKDHISSVFVYYFVVI